MSCNQSQPTPTKSRSLYPNGLTAVQVFDLRTKCAEMVEKKKSILAGFNDSEILTATARSHYNPDTNRCYAEIQTEQYPYRGQGAAIFAATSLYDAQTQQLLLDAHQAHGENQSGDDWRRSASGTGYITYDEAIKRMNELMQEDAQ